MWPFKAQPGVSELRESVSTLERQLKALKLDQDDLFDRFSRLSGRLAKRAEREQTSLTETDQGASVETSTSALAPTFSRLSPQQRRIQMEILARRRAPNGGS